MPSDRYMDDYYDNVDKTKAKIRQQNKLTLIEKFSKMSSEEKLKFLVAKYIEDHI